MLSALPTTLRLPRNRMAFRLTHRFNQPLEDSGIDDLWGMDSGALIGFEFRYGVIPGGQVGFYRTSDSTIQLFSQYDVFKQSASMPVGIAAFGSIEGTDNFTDKYSPTIGAIISREFGTRAAVYAHPFWVNNTNPEPSDLVDDNSTTMLGFGLRLRVLSATYFVVEAAPRVIGLRPRHDARVVRHRTAGRRPSVPAHLRQQPGHDAGQRGPRRPERQQLVPRLQPREKVLLGEAGERTWQTE